MSLYTSAQAQLAKGGIGNNKVSSVTDLDPVDLWADAFKEFEKANSELAAKFKALLDTEANAQAGSKPMGAISTPKTVKTNSPDVMRANHNVAVKALKTIQEIEDSKQSSHELSSKIRSLFEETIKMVLKTSDLVSPALAFNPYAATAWSAVCFILPFCLTSSKENEAAIQGLYTISNLMTVYKWKEKVYLHSDPDGDFAQATIRLYVAILEYEATLLVHKHRSSVKRLTSNVSKSGQWETLQSKIKQLDLDCNAITLAVDAARAQDWENEQREWRLAQIRDVQNEKMRANIRKLYSKYEEGKNANPLPGKGTGEWFLRNTSFLHWRNSSTSNCLWLKGEPGLGKSVLARHLVENRTLTSIQNTTPLICYFFFKKHDREKDTATKALCALLHQIYLQNPGLYKYAEVDFENKGDVFLTDLDALWAIFRDSVLDTELGEVVCILDAIDECEGVSRDKLIGHLTKFYQSSSSSASSYLKVLITSRPTISISHSFESLQLMNSPSVGIVNGSDAEDDLSREIEMFIAQEVAEIAKNLSLTKRQEKFLKSKLFETPNRTYLWLHLVLDLVRKSEVKKGASLSRLFGDIPLEVEQAYNDLLNKIPDAYIEDIRAAFVVILAAYRPLTLNELEGALYSICLSKGNMPEISSYEFEWVQYSLEYRSGLFLKVVDDRVYLIHQTARDFLTWSLNSSALSIPLIPGIRNWKGAFPSVENHHILSSACVSLLKSQFVQENATVYNLRLRTTTRDWWIKFLDYAATYWAFHFSVAESEIYDSELTIAISSELYGNERVFNIWSSIYKGSLLGQNTDFPTKRSSILWSSYFGHKSILNQELNINIDLDQKDSCQRSALLYACEQGHADVAELLLTRGASIESQDILYSSALSTAAYSGNESLVKRLIDRGVAINHIDVLHLTPFQYASHQRHSGCMQLLKVKQPETDTSVAGTLISEDEAIESLKPVMQMVRDSHSTALKSDLWIHDREDQLCYSSSILSGTGFSALYNGLLSGLRTYDQKNYPTARSQLLYAISHTEMVLHTESPLILPHFLRLLARIDHHRLPKLALALCQHIVYVADAAKSLSGMVKEVFSNICRILTESQVKVSVLVDVFLDHVIEAFRTQLKPHHMQTVYIQHLQIETRTLMCGPIQILPELEAMLADVKTNREENSPQYIQLLIDLSQTRLDCKQYKQAEEVAQQIVARSAELRSKPNGNTGKTLRMQCEGHRLMAESQSTQGFFDEAEVNLRQAIKLSRSLPRMSIFSTVDKYEMQFADWLRARGRKEEAAKLVTKDDANMTEEIVKNQSIYHYFLKRNKPLKDAQDEFEVLKQRVTTLWPERLLCVNDMTSHQREDDDIYGATPQPTYNILSYKWGLWVVPQGDRLDVEGIDWEMPAVDPQRWTISEMEQVLENIAQEVDFVWLDVACVNQSQNSATMAEIHREPGIFMNAKEVFVWLVDCPEKDMDRFLNMIADVAQDLPARSSEQFDDWLIFNALDKALDPLTKVLSCAWFRSHWTLREIIGRRDATLLNRQGSPILLHCRNDEKAKLDLLVFVCQHLLAFLIRQETVISGNTNSSGTVQESRWHNRIDEVKTRFLDLINVSGPFLLFAYHPLDLRSITETLLKIGQMVTEGPDSAHYSHGAMTMSCTCSCKGLDRCLACIMGISYKVGDTIVDSKTGAYLV